MQLNKTKCVCVYQKYTVQHRTLLSTVTAIIAVHVGAADCMTRWHQWLQCIL